MDHSTAHMALDSIHNLARARLRLDFDCYSGWESSPDDPAIRL